MRISVLPWLGGRTVVFRQATAICPDCRMIAGRNRLHFPFPFDLFPGFKLGKHGFAFLDLPVRSGASQMDEFKVDAFSSGAF